MATTSTSPVSQEQLLSIDSTFPLYVLLSAWSHEICTIAQDTTREPIRLMDTNFEGVGWKGI